MLNGLDSLRFYDAPSWQEKDVVETVDEGLGFTIIDKASVDGSPQYKVKNSRGNVFYITASSYYVKIK
ncbi:N-acetylmuramoyl-L-alanine amidase [Bacillus wiedmannii]|nr:N-acetylmuramoyl-L-alanine amidase [Bacillus wiedmannii]